MMSRYHFFHSESESAVPNAGVFILGTNGVISLDNLGSGGGGGSGGDGGAGGNGAGGAASGQNGEPSAEIADGVPGTDGPDGSMSVINSNWGTESPNGWQSFGNGILIFICTKTIHTLILSSTNGPFSVVGQLNDPRLQFDSAAGQAMVETNKPVNLRFVYRWLTALSIQFSATNANTLSVSWFGTTNENYQVQSRPSLGGGAWTSLGSLVPGEGAVSTLALPVAPAESARFYRLVMTPAS
jgi:hypothetical protein